MRLHCLAAWPNLKYPSHSLVSFYLSGRPWPPDSRSAEGAAEKGRDPFSPFMSPGRACQVRGVLVPPSLRPPNWVCLAMIVRVQVATVCGYVFSPSWCLDRQHQDRPLPSVPPDPRSRKCWPSWSGFPGGSAVRNLLAMQETSV